MQTSSAAAAAACGPSLSRSLELAQATIKKLKTQIDNLERENRDLKRTVYDLNFEQARLVASIRQPLAPFDIGQALAAVAASSSDRDSTIECEAAALPVKQGAAAAQLVCKSTLKGHGGAVYDIAWSPSGSVLASGSFDGSCRLWDLESSRLIRPNEPVVLADSQRNVSSLCWMGSDSTKIVTASYDGTANVWDTVSKSVSFAVNAQGAIQSVSSSSDVVFFVATSQGVISGFDTRSGSNPICQITNGAMVNTIVCLADYKQVLSGDHTGNLKCWSTSKGQCLSTTAVSSSPISHISCNGEFLSVNSFDNVIRLYDRPSMGIIYELIGHKNRNWPIRSAIFINNDQSDDSPEDDPILGGHSSNSFLVASGSADSGVYLFDVGATRLTAQSKIAGRNLEGHRDRVYSVAFHREKLILASCSADTTIKIWK